LNSQPSGKLAGCDVRSESKMKILPFLILCSASVALADDFKAIDGKEYKNVKVIRVEPDGIVLVSKSGISKVYFTELPKEIQDRFHYEAVQAAAYSAEQTASQMALQTQQAELRRKLAEEKTDIGPDKNRPKTSRLRNRRLLRSLLVALNRSE
jgi:hypothetical protein